MSFLLVNVTTTFNKDDLECQEDIQTCMQINHRSTKILPNNKSRKTTEKLIILKNKPPIHPDLPLELQKSNSLTIANVSSNINHQQNGMGSPHLSLNNIAGGFN